MTKTLALHKATYETQYEQGKTEEDKNFEFVKTVFNQPFLKKSAYRYTHYDFYSDKYIFELKTINNDINKYKHVLLGVNKLICENSVFIFNFVTGGGKENEMYYLKADYEIFNTFDTGYIKGANRIDFNNVYFIPVQYLIKLNIGDKIELKYNNDMNEKTIFDKAIKDDTLYGLYTEIMNRNKNK